MQTSHSANLSEETTVLQGGLEVASEYVTAGCWQSRCIVMGGGRPALVQVSTCLPLCSALPSDSGEGTDCPLLAPFPLSLAANSQPLFLLLLVSMLTNTWPLPALPLVGFLAEPCPTPAPANVLLDCGCRCCQTTLHTSPPVMLLQEVLILGAILGDEDRVVLAVEEDTVTVGTLLPTTTHGE